MRKYLSGVSQGMVATILCAVLAPIAKRYLPGTILNLALGAVVAIVLWGCVIAAIVVTFIQLQRLKKKIVRLLDSRCTDLMASCQAIKDTYPSYQGSLAAATYLPNANPDEVARAAIYRFNARLKDFADDLELAGAIPKIKLRKPNPTGTLSDVGQALNQVHNQFQSWLF
jgi:hypothetical protein